MRYPPLKAEEMTPRQREVAEAIDKRRVGGLVGPYIPLIYSPEVADRMQLLAEHLRYNLRTPERLRILAILVTARHKSADVEFFAHMKHAKTTGLAEEKVQALAEGRRPQDMTPDEEMVYDYCTELHKTGAVGDANFDRVQKRFGNEICLELVSVCGYFALLAMVLNVTETPFPEGQTRPLNPPVLP